MLHYTSSSAGMANHHHHQYELHHHNNNDNNNTNNNIGATVGSLTASNTRLLPDNNNDTSSSTNTTSARNTNRQSIGWEYHEITLERGSSGLGFTVAGGVDNPHYTNDNSIYITRFIPNGPAALDGRLKLDDIIVQVDSTDLIDVRHSEAVGALKNSGNRVQLLIKRKKPIIVSGRSHSPVTNNINLFNNKFKTQNNNSNNNNNFNDTLKSSTNNQTRLFTSTLSTNPSSSTTQTNQLPPLPRSVQISSAISRGSAQYSTTRESNNINRAPKLKSASSSQSLQRQDEIDSIAINRANLLFGKENNTAHSKSTSAIDSDVAKNITRLPRTVILQRSSKGLGFNIVGGVAGGGTFISYIVPGGTAERSNKLHCGDQILSVNGKDLRLSTHEEAATTLKQAGQTVKLVVKFKPEEYIKFENKINDLRERNMLSTGTLQTTQKKSLYARSLFDYDPSKDSGLPSKGLQFKFGDILHITNASDDEWWQARKVLESGQDDTVHGIIPSKKRVEKRERARLKTVKFISRNSSESMLDRRRKKFSFSKKFPFMKSRENIGEFDEFDLDGSQSNSRRILSASSTTSINNYSERGSIKNDGDDIILSYEPVRKQEIDYKRPIALYGSVKDEIENLREDLSCDDRFYKMEHIVPYTTRPPKLGEVDGGRYHFVSMQQMKRDLAEHRFVEAGELNGNLYGTSIDSIRQVAKDGKHCLLNISHKAIKRLHEAKLFPITIFIKPKSIESLLEMNKRWSHDEAANAMEMANRLEQELNTYITTTIHMDNPNQVLEEILYIIDQQSGPIIWTSISNSHHQ